MRNFFLLLFLLNQIAYCQNSEIVKLRLNGEKAYLNNDFKTANDLYKKWVVLDSLSKDAWYNLGASELNLENSEQACENFYKAYQLNDGEALNEIRKHCPNFRNGAIMFIDEVDEQPKFIYEGKEYFLFENKNLNAKYLEILTKEIKKSKTLKSKVKGKVFVQIHINSMGIFDGKIIRVGTDEKDVSIVKMEMQNIFRNVVKYIPAQHNGRNVDTFEKWSLPIDFGK